MNLLNWLNSLFASKEIQKLQVSIAKNEADIEGIRPIEREAVKRTDDQYYVIRSRVALGRRRLAYTENKLAQDLNEGWKGRK